MKENMQKVEDAIIENLQINLKKHLDKYLSDNNDAEWRKDLSEWIFEFDENEHRFKSNFIPALHAGKSQDVVRWAFAWFDFQLDYNTYGDYLPIMLYLSDEEVELFISALKTAKKTYEYWMLLVVMFYCDEITMTEDEQSYLLLAAIKCDKTHFLPYSRLLANGVLTLTSAVAIEIENILDDVFQNRPDLPEKLFFNIPGERICMPSDYNPYFSLSEWYWHNNDMDGFVRNFTKGVSENNANILVPYNYLCEYEISSGMYEKAILTYEKLISEFERHDAAWPRDYLQHYLMRVNAWEIMPIEIFREFLDTVFSAKELPPLHDFFRWVTDNDISRPEVADFIDIEALSKNDTPKVYDKYRKSRDDAPSQYQNLDLSDLKMDQELLSIRLKEVLLHIVSEKTYDYKKLWIGLEPIRRQLSSYERTLTAQQHERKIAAAKVAERDQILSDISHSIKNLLPSTIIDPLVRLQANVNPENTATIERALRGADLIGRLVESINNASSGCFEDFLYDAENKTEDAMSLRNIIYNSIFFSIGNIFHARNSSKLRSKYFMEDKRIELKAKEALGNLEPNDFEQLSAFCEEYLFDCDFKIKGLDEYILSDAKGSAMKMLIMFQEIIFNAVKHSRLVKRDDRFLNVSIIPDADSFAVEITNSASFKYITKETGLGQTIIEKMAGLMKAEYNTSKGDDCYCVKMRIPSFWNLTESGRTRIKYIRNNDSKYSMVSEKKGDYKV